MENRYLSKKSKKKFVGSFKVGVEEGLVWIKIVVICIFFFLICFCLFCVDL